MTETAKAWTLADLDRLPDDGNKYEIVRGELFVTPTPTVAHESLASLLHSVLRQYVQDQQLGGIFMPRAVVRIAGSQVEPDLAVRADVRPIPEKWEDAPVPILIVEILSDGARRRHYARKREYYLDSGVAEYWIVDGENRTIRVISRSTRDVVATTELVWRPERASKPFVLDVAAYFRTALG